MTSRAGFESAGATAAARRLVYAARGVRGFGDGFAIIILPAYLSAIGLDPVRIGIVAAASLLGSAVLTLAVGLRAFRYDLRQLLLAGAIMMALTGIALPTFEHFAFIVFVVFVGTVNASAGDIGVLVPLEHAMLAQSVPDHERTGTFARYSIIGALATAAGTLAAAAPDFLSLAGIGHLVAFKSMFYAYAALGLVSAALYHRLPRARAEAPHGGMGLGPSRGIVYRLAALFSLDAFAGGFAVQSLLALWLFQRFNLSLSAVSAFFFWSSVFGAFSYPVAVRIAAVTSLFAATSVWGCRGVVIVVQKMAAASDMDPALTASLGRNPLSRGRKTRICTVVHDCNYCVLRYGAHIMSNVYPITSARRGVVLS